MHEILRLKITRRNLLANALIAASAGSGIFSIYQSLGAVRAGVEQKILKRQNFENYWIDSATVRKSRGDHIHEQLESLSWSRMRSQGLAGLSLVASISLFIAGLIKERR